MAFRVAGMLAMRGRASARRAALRRAVESSQGSKGVPSGVLLWSDPNMRLWAWVGEGVAGVGSHLGGDGDIGQQGEEEASQCFYF